MMITKPIKFSKMSGAGNDFILINNRDGRFSELDENRRLAKTLCRRKFSVGADGLILIEKSAEADFRWQFFNADGSLADMCGNGARCAARFAFAKGIAPEKMRFLTLAGLIEAEVLTDSVSLAMTAPKSLKLNLKLEGPDGGEVLVHSLDTGVPHAVIICDDIEQTPVKEWGSYFRFHQCFAPAGSNINFISRLDDGRLKVRTYERGVEDETYACGTGAVASALIAARLGLSAPPLCRVITSGNEELLVHYQLADDDQFSRVRLEGAAEFIYEAETAPFTLLA